VPLGWISNRFHEGYHKFETLVGRKKRDDTEEGNPSGIVFGDGIPDLWAGHSIEIGEANYQNGEDKENQFIVMQRCAKSSCINNQIMP